MRGWTRDLVEEAEVDGIRHRRVAGVFGVQMIAAVISGRIDEWVRGIAGGLVEVNHAIEGVTVADPVIDGFADFFASSV